MLSHTDLLQHITVLDWIVFFAVLALTFASVIYGQKLKGGLSDEEKSSTIELLLMGRRLTLPLFVATLVATWYGGIFGVTALTYEKGIYNFLTQGLFWYLSYFIFAFFLVKKIRRHEVLTLPELAGRLFGPRAEGITALMNFLNLLPIAYTISLGLFFKALFGGSLLINTSVGVALVTAWSLWGGFRAVVFSDVVQFFFMIFSVFIVVVFAWAQMGSPLWLMKELPPSHLDWSGGEALSATLVWGFIALSTLVDPNFYQRCLAAKDEKVARRGIYISIIVWIFFDCCTTLGALYARVALPAADPQSAYIIFCMQLLPAGLKGVLLAGVLAIILSTLDAYLFNAATCVSYDLLNLKGRFKHWQHHVALVFVGLLSIVAGSFFEGNVVEVWKTLGSFSAACLLCPLLIGQTFPGVIGEKVFILAVTLGCISIVVWRVLNYHYHFSSIDEFYIGLFMTTFTLLPSLVQRMKGGFSKNY
jgi:SSS family solute:Na+ symporter